MRTTITAISLLCLLQLFVLGEEYTYTYTKNTESGIKIIKRITEINEKDSSYVVGDTTVSLEISYRYEKTVVLHEFLADSLTKENVYYIGNRIDWENRKDTTFCYEGKIKRDLFLCQRTELGKEITTVEFEGDSVTIRERKEDITAFSYNILYAVLVVIVASVIGLLSYYKRINTKIHIAFVISIGVIAGLITSSALALGFIFIILAGSILSVILFYDSPEDGGIFLGIPYIGSVIMFLVVLFSIFNGSLAWGSIFVPAIFPLVHGIFEVYLFQKNKL